MEPLPLSGLLAFDQSQQDPLGTKKSCRQIGNRDSDPHRSSSRLSGDGHQSAHSLGNLIESRSFGIGAVLSETRDTGKNDLGVAGFQTFIIDSKPLFNIGSVVFHNHIRILNQLLEN